MAALCDNGTEQEERDRTAEIQGHPGGGEDTFEDTAKQAGRARGGRLAAAPPLGGSRYLTLRTSSLPGVLPPSVPGRLQTGNRRSVDERVLREVSL
jgi:hypothetical protein